MNSAIQEMDLEQRVMSLLGQNTEWKTAAELLAAIPGAEKVTVNRTLYALKAQGRVDYTSGIPPIWRAKVQEDAPELPTCDPAPRVHCIIDLGNTHDCLQNLEAYAAGNMLTVSAYADLAFSGYGIAPRVSCNNVEVFHADTPDKNSADVQIIWDVCKLVERMKETQVDQKLHILVATKDMGFLRLKHLVEQHPFHTLTFVTNWETLRMHIE